MVVFVLAVGIYVAVAAVTDARMHRIPNWITVPAALLGLVFHSVSPTGFGPAASLIGLAVGFAILFVPWLFGGSGMGDVKLLAALGAWLGWKALLVAFAIAIVFAAVATLAILAIGVVAGNRPGKSAPDLRQLTSGRHRSQPAARVLPFAIPVALSTWSVLAWMVVQGGL